MFNENELRSRPDLENLLMNQGLRVAPEWVVQSFGGFGAVGWSALELGAGVAVGTYNVIKEAGRAMVQGRSAFEVGRELGGAAILVGLVLRRGLFQPVRNYIREKLEDNSLFLKITRIVNN